MIKKKVLLLLTLFAVTNNELLAQNSQLIDKLNNIEYKASSLLSDNKISQNQLMIKNFNTEFLKKINNIENYSTRKEIHKEQIEKIERSLYKVEKINNIYAKGFLSSIGYGFDLSYYYKNFVGIGFIFNNQDKNFSNFFGNLLLETFWLLDSSVEMRHDTVFPGKKANFKTHSLIAYLSMRPFRNGFHVDVGLSFSKIIANGYTLQMSFTNEEGIEIRKRTEDTFTFTMDNYSAKPYLNIGYDFTFKNVILGIDGGIMSFKTKSSQSLVQHIQQTVNSNELYDATINELHNLPIYLYQYINIAIPQLEQTALYLKLSLGYRFAF